MELRGEIEPQFYGWLVHRRMVQSSTACDYVRSVRHVASHAGVRAFEIGTPHLEGFLADPDISWNTKSLRHIAVRIWHKWGADRGFWPLSPELMSIRLPRKRRIAQPALDVDQARRVLAWATTPLEKRVAYVGLYAGLRPAEIRDLSPGQWTVGFSGIQKLTVQGKATSPEREVPVHPLLEPLRDEILSIKPSRKQVLKVAEQIREGLGIEGFETRWLRRTFGRALRELGVPREVIGALLGHTPSSVTEYPYVPVTVKEMSDAIRTLTYGSDQLGLW